MLATPDPLLPVLNRIVEAPVCALTGLLQRSRGITPRGSLARTRTGRTDSRCTDEPTADDVREAVRRLMDVLLDFPVVSDADMAHAFGLALLPFARDMIVGPTPNHMIESPCPGSGKNLLFDTVMSPAAGGNIGVVAEARNEEEMRKRITAQLRNGRPAILLDNITRTLDSGVLPQLSRQRIGMTGYSDSLKC